MSRCGNCDGELLDLGHFCPCTIPDCDLGPICGSCAGTIRRTVLKWRGKVRDEGTSATRPTPVPGDGEGTEPRT